MRIFGLRVLIASCAIYPVLAFAQVQIICRLQKNVSPSLVAKSYAITLKDSTEGAPFALYSVSKAKAAQVLTAMSNDRARIVWADDDAQLACPEGKSRSAPKKGGGLPAVGDRRKLQAINKNFLAQISWDSKLSSSAGRAVRLAILDTGLGQRQTALWAKVEASVNFVEPGSPAYDLPRRTDSNGNRLYDEASGHGTMIAGIVDMVAPKVRLVVARVADSDGNATAWTLIKGLAFSVTSGCEVANVSLGSLNQVPALRDVMDWCEENRLLVVAAIGNDGLREACFPAKVAKSICVGGLNPDNTKASFSNWDGTCDASAPATGIASQFWDGQLAIWSGTSFSTPMVAAAVADCLRRGSNPGLNALRTAIQKSGDSLDSINLPIKGQVGRLLNHVRLEMYLRRP